MASHALSLAVLLSCLLSAAAYLPGVGPRKYKQGDQLPLYVNELSSLRTQVPFDFYSLPYCPLASAHHQEESLGACRVSPLNVADAACASLCDPVL
jgi:transmembrane 9 superfamily protein 2/4